MYFYVETILTTISVNTLENRWRIIDKFNRKIRLTNRLAIVDLPTYNRKLACPISS